MTVRAGFELVDHTSEVILRLWAGSFGGLLVQATHAYSALVPDHLWGDPADDVRSFDIDGGDQTATVVAWINELVYLSEAEAWIPLDPVVEESAASRVRVEARRRLLQRPFVLVKAATLHGAQIHEADGGFQLEVTLDL